MQLIDESLSLTYLRFTWIGRDWTVGASKNDVNLGPDNTAFGEMSVGAAERKNPMQNDNTVLSIGFLLVFFPSHYSDRSDNPACTAIFQEERRSKFRMSSE